MTSLGWLIHAPDIVDEGAGIICTLPTGGVWMIGNDELWDLHLKGWVDLQVDEHVIVTEKGVYWHEKWRRETTRAAFKGYGPLAKGQSRVRLRMGPNGCLILNAGGIEVKRG
jgi:hypothetical protein